MATRILRSSTILAAALALSGCASAPVERQQPMGHAGHIGALLCPAEDGLRVLQVSPGQSAARAGMKEGDLITGFQGQDMAPPASRQALLWDVHNKEGQALEFTVKRGGSTLKFTLAPTRKELYSEDVLYSVLRDEVMTGRKVSVAIVVTLVNHTTPEAFKNAEALSAWKAGMRDSLFNFHEGMLLNKGLLRCGNYAVVDRDKTKQVLDELHFQMSGTVSPETTKELGKMTGASHLLFLSLTRYRQASGSYQDVTNARLVAVETGNVAASVRFQQTLSAR